MANNHKAQQLTNILKSVGEGIYGVDENLITTFFNSAAENLLGWSAEEIIGKKQHALTHHTRADGSDYPAEECQMYMAVKDGEIRHVKDELFWRKDGTSFPVEYTTSPIKDDAGNVTGAVVVFHDVSKEKALQEALKTAVTEAESAVKLKSEFLANMSHEIRTPMNGVMGMVNLLLNTKLDSEQRSYAQTAIYSSEALLDIINDILDFSKIEAGKLELENITFDLQMLAEDVAELMSLKAREKNVEMLLRYAPNTPRYVIGDPGRVRQILLNLISNAIKFTEEGYVLVSIEAGKYKGDKLIFNCLVQDTGIGIAKDKLKFIFNKFDQADESTTRKFGGTGLGLAISNELIAMMRGDVSVESIEGEGSTFLFSMQLEPNTDEAAIIPTTGRDLTGIRILVVDGNKTARTILCEQLKAFNLDIEQAESAKESITLLEAAANNKAPFNIVITDKQMPDMNGEELGKYIKASALLNRTILILCTAHPDKGDGKNFLEQEFAGYLTKPVHHSILPKMFSVLLTARDEGETIPLITRHTLREAEGSHTEQQLLFENKRVLLTEDNRVNQMVAVTMLEQYGCIVTTAENGKAAVVQVKKQRFDLIFMDYHMPEMDGFEATAEIRDYEKKHNLPRTPIVAFTAAAMEGDKQKGLEVGMTDYITKPVKPDELKRVLLKWVTDNTSGVPLSRQG